MIVYYRFPFTDRLLLITTSLEVLTDERQTFFMYFIDLWWRALRPETRQEPDDWNWKMR